MRVESMLARKSAGLVWRRQYSESALQRIGECSCLKGFSETISLIGIWRRENLFSPNEIREALELSQGKYGDCFVNDGRKAITRFVLRYRICFKGGLTMFDVVVIGGGLGDRGRGARGGSH